MTFPHGNRDLVLHYVSHTIEGNELTITLKDIQRQLFVELRSSLDSATGIIGRSSIIRNKIAEPVMIEQAVSATWNLPQGTDYSLRYLAGRWGAEWNLEQHAISLAR